MHESSQLVPLGCTQTMRSFKKLFYVLFLLLSGDWKLQPNHLAKKLKIKTNQHPPAIFPQRHKEITPFVSVFLNKGGQGDRADTPGGAASGRCQRSGRQTPNAAMPPSRPHADQVTWTTLGLGFHICRVGIITGLYITGVLQRSIS